MSAFGLMTPTVSIIVNVYNGERYVAECLDSIERLEGGYALQVLVVDDASSDGTAKVLSRYDRPPFEVVRLEKNVGAAAAVSHAFGLVKGKYVARIDYDDRYNPNFLTASMAALDRHPDAAFVCGRVRQIDAGGRPGVVSGPHDYGEEAGCRDRFRSLLTRHFVTAPTILGRPEHWRRAIPVPKGMDFCDWYMNLTMAEAAPVAVIDDVTADYRIHPLNMHSTKVKSGMGERVTFEVLDRFLVSSTRAQELAPHARAIRARHFADWGDKYFGAGMNAEALRCYKAALRLAPSQAWRGKFLHRLVGLTVGRERYDVMKSYLSGRPR
jgi:glycosyltransferase involved in cell wall biosynthesis